VLKYAEIKENTQEVVLVGTLQTHPLKKLSEPGCQLKSGMVLGEVLFCVCENGASFLCEHHTATVTI
jgi:hypothetical protein